LIVAAAVFGEQVSEDINDCVVFQVAKFSRIEEATATDSAVLEMDMRLVESNHADRMAAATRAEDAINAIELAAEFRVTNLDLLGPLISRRSSFS
jgi:hypothetical protein